MGKKAKKKAQTPTRVKRTPTHLQKTIPQQKIAIDEVVDSIPVQNDSKSCAHLEKGFNVNALSEKIGSSEPVKCEDCREGAAERRGNKGRGKHGKKKGGAASDLKSESKAVWVCLECGHYSCGGVGFPTTAQSHALRHARQSHHPLAVQFENPNLRWCFPCNAPLLIDKMPENELKDALSKVAKLIKGPSVQTPSTDVEDVWFGSGSVANEVKLLSSATNSLDGRGSYIVRGLINLGNTCFFNSVMQILLALDRLRDHLLKLDTSIGPLTISLKKLFTEAKMEIGVKNPINPRSLFGSICSKAPQFRGYQQHDSHELLHCLLDALSTEEFDMKKRMGSSKEDEVLQNQSVTFVDAVFGGQISSTVRCVECGHSSTVYEPFLDLSLPVPTKKPPPKKPPPVSRAKKGKLLPKKGGKTRAKFNKDSEFISIKSTSGTSAKAEASFTSKFSPPDDSREGTDSVVISERVASPADHSSYKEHGDVQTSREGAAVEATSLDDCTWLDYIGPDITSNEVDSALQSNNLTHSQHSGMGDTIVLERAVASPGTSSVQKFSDAQIFEKEMEQKAVSVNDLGWLDYLDPKPTLGEKTQEDCHKTVVYDVSHGERFECSVNADEGSYLKEESSTRNSLEDEKPHQVQDQEVLLLPYKESISTTPDIIGDSVTSSMSFRQDELEFDGFGDLFNEPDIAYGPVYGPSLSGEMNEVAESSFTAADNSSESDPGEVDHSGSPVSIESCLTHFTKQELLSNDNAWHCEKCSQSLCRQQLEDKKQAKLAATSSSNGSETKTISANLVSEFQCSTKARKLCNGHIGNGKFSNDANKEDAGKLGIPSRMSLSDDGADESCAVGQLDSTSCSIHRVLEVDSKLSRECATDIIDNDETDLECMKVKRDATKRVLIYKAPPVLTIHLKRFSQDSHGRLSKLSGHVIFRETIDMRPFMDSRGEEKKKCVYRLMGVVEHSGTMRGGHYVAYIRGGEKKKNGDGSSVWFHASDTYVREVTLEEVLRSEAYILFYEII